MHTLPASLIASLKKISGFSEDAFIQLHESAGQVTSVRLNPARFSIEECHLQIESKVSWTGNGYYLSERPSFTFDPLFHAGCYYVQEASSMFLEQALKQTVDLSGPLHVLDLCAAPGGKSTHIQSLISPDSLLVSNEVIKSRCNILKDNIIKWGCENVVVTNNDPASFARLKNYFDVIVVDAPCSGSGLFRKEPDAIEHWSENNVQLCSQRQQRILADVWPALKQNGVLIYSTCSYSKEEDEDIVNWMNENFETKNEELNIENFPGVQVSKDGYRFWPDKVKGEGFFISVFRKTGDGETENFRAGKNLMQLSSKELEFVKPWCIQNADMSFVHGFDGVYIVNKQQLSDISLLNSLLRVAYFGVKAGELKQNKLVPAHALAMSKNISASVRQIPLDFNQAISYLQKKEIGMENKTTGWQLVNYNNHSLGWVNVLPGRVNNYYPKELRILKEI